MDKLATMGTIGSSFRPRLSYYGICLLNRHQTGDTDSVQPVILLPVQRDSQETFIPCEARMLWYSADRTSSQQLRDTTRFWASSFSSRVNTAVAARRASLICRSSSLISHSRPAFRSSAHPSSLLASASKKAAFR